MSLEHQNPSKTSEKWVILIALQFRYTFYRPQTKRLRARKIGLQYKIRFHIDKHNPITLFKMKELVYIGVLPLHNLNGLILHVCKT